MRQILHADLNNFYASVECLMRPEMRDKPVVVGGDPEARHGIVLAKNNLAKACGVITGQALWQAKSICPGLVVLKPNYPVYLKVSRKVRALFGEYTDQVEPFGLDEAWLDVTGSASLFGDGRHIADTIRQRIKDELGITASVGVADNKIFAKLGSDMRKPDATTVITRENYRETVWPLPAKDLLYVGPSTWKKLDRVGLSTIGSIAQSPPELLSGLLGKWGTMLHEFANGHDHSFVETFGEFNEASVIKSIGNSTTTPRDLENDEDVRLTVWMLSESVAARLREHGFRCGTVQIHVRDNALSTFERQAKLAKPSQLSSEIAELAMRLFRANYTWERPIRSVGVRGCGLVTAGTCAQLSMFPEDNRRINQEALEQEIDHIRGRFGHFIIQRGHLLVDRRLTQHNPKDEHVIHPVAYFR